MSVLEIKKFDAPTLREKAIKINEITPEIKELAFDMVETMEKDNGIGLAANQAGILKRIIVVKPEEKAIVLINPKIIKKSKEKSVLEEGCLSFPGYFLKIERPKEIEVEALDLNGNKVSIKAEGIMAHVFGHEIDHLDGIKFFQRLRFWDRIKFKLKHKWA